MKLRIGKALDVALCVVVTTIAVDIHPMAFDLDADELRWAKEGV